MVYINTCVAGAEYIQFPLTLVLPEPIYTAYINPCAAGTYIYGLH